MSRGRPQKYTDTDLKNILVKIVSQNPGKKLTPSYLENSTGIKRHVWSRRMQETIDKLNQPIQIISRDESQLPLPNVVQLVEHYWENKTGLIKALSHFNETLQNLYGQIRAYDKENEKYKLLKQEIQGKDDKIKELNKELNYYKDLYLKTAVKSSYKSYQDKDGLKNVISISANKYRGLDTDFISNFPELFDDDDDVEEEN